MIISTKPYDIEHFEKFGKNHEMYFFTETLNSQTVDFIQNADAVCVFVNDEIDNICAQKLAKKKIHYIAQRCAGFNNVDLINTGRGH